MQRCVLPVVVLLLVAPGGAFAAPPVIKDQSESVQAQRTPGGVPGGDPEIYDLARSAPNAWNGTALFYANPAGTGTGLLRRYDFAVRKGRYKVWAAVPVEEIPADATDYLVHYAWYSRNEAGSEVIDGVDIDQITMPSLDLLYANDPRGTEVVFFYLGTVDHDPTTAKLPLKISVGTSGGTHFWADAMAVQWVDLYGAASSPVHVADGLPASSTQYVSIGSFQLTVSGGNGPYSWVKSGGSLPTGVSLTATGQLIGTPTTSGTFGFTVVATDADGAADTHEFTWDVASGEAGEGEGGTVTLPSGLQWVSYNATTPAWWYMGPLGAQTTPTTPNLIQGGLNNVENDGSRGAGLAGAATGFGGQYKDTLSSVVMSGTQVACMMDSGGVAFGSGAGVVAGGEFHGCGYNRWQVIVFWRNLISGTTYQYFAGKFTLTHGRNGYVSWAPNTSQFNGSGGQYMLQSSNFTTWSPAGFNVQQQFIKFPAPAALESLMTNGGGLVTGDIFHGGGTGVKAAYLSKFVPSSEVSAATTALTALRDSLSSKVDMTSIPRCSGQDIEATGSGGSGVDHVNDAGASPGIAAADLDGDGVIDYLDPFPQNAARTNANFPTGAATWNTYKDKLPKWSFTGVAPEQFRTNQFASFSVPIKKPTLTGPVDWLSVDVDLNPAHNLGAAGTAIDSLRVVCRAFGVCWIVFLTVGGVLKTFRNMV